MTVELVQGYAPFAAASLVLLVAIIFLGVRRRLAAAEAQAFHEKAYGESVAAYRAQVEHLLGRRAELLDGIAAIESGHVDERLAEHDIDTSDAVARIELDVVLAGDDHERRASSLRTLRRGVSDIEMLLPEAPLPPEPVARLSRAARRRAESWTQQRTEELAALRGLARLTPATAAITVPSQAMGPRREAKVLEDAVS